ncbi:MULTISPECIES: DUF6580 family putative transport protein [Oerskovia]|uniref:Rod shape-determining protein MreD n=2 Tax=Oerskovia TaxID=162491 RepID=A0A161XGY0_9CELL|nr:MULTISPECIES: DUF6580 family putative transport protein [Oerskovia]KRD36580.1 hypothetical protein ASE27_08670 [Oerskovia sp. Root918]KZM36077.1 hypothetical protein OJAG_12810 [Oerskovia enterophila]MBD7981964.1 hypothetical protein [Oerskovia merdavium]
MEARDLLTRWWRPAIAVAFVALAIVFRLVREEIGAPPNLELVTSAAFVAAVLVRHRLAFLAPLVVAVVSDLALGNTSIALFTWSAWLVVGLAALLTRSTSGWGRVGAAAGLGVGGSLWFFFWTNFGVWFQGRGVWYPAGLDGLVASYVAGLPFLRTMLVGNLVLLPVVAAGTLLVERLERSRGLVAVPQAA